MLETASGYYENHEEGGLSSKPGTAIGLAVIAEPSPDRFLIVVTAYPGSIIDERRHVASLFEVTYRDGEAAGLPYLPRRSGDRSVRVEQRGGYLVDWSDNGVRLNRDASPSRVTLRA
jgi:hypothetical protein